MLKYTMNAVSTSILIKILNAAREHFIGVGATFHINNGYWNPFIDWIKKISSVEFSGLFAAIDIGDEQRMHQLSVCNIE